MQRRRVLVADHHEEDALVLRKTLVGEGYEVRCVADGEEALQACETFHPQLIYADARLPVVDGPHLVREIRTRFQNPPILFVLAAETDNVDERLHYMNLDIDDFLRKPFDLDEFTARIELLFREASVAEATHKSSHKGFAGDLKEMNLVDLLQTLEVGKKTGVLRLNVDGREGVVFLRDGEVVDAAVDDLQAVDALHRLFTWSEGNFFVEMRPIDRERTIEGPNKRLWTEGMRRLDEWEKLRRQLPPLKTVVVRNTTVDVSELEDEHRALWTLLSEPKRLIDLVYDSDLEDLVALERLAELYHRGALQALPAEEFPANGTVSLGLHHTDHNGQPAENKLRVLFSSLFGKKEDRQPASVHNDRWRQERRHGVDRRTRTRRNDEGRREKNSVYLSRSELLVIRERLLQG
jgi:CheY-like chemotaxis protein